MWHRNWQTCQKIIVIIQSRNEEVVNQAKSSKDVQNSIFFRQEPYQGQKYDLGARVYVDNLPVMEKYS